MALSRVSFEMYTRCLTLCDDITNNCVLFTCYKTKLQFFRRRREEVWPLNENSWTVYVQLRVPCTSACAAWWTMQTCFWKFSVFVVKLTFTKNNIQYIAYVHWKVLLSENWKKYQGMKGFTLVIRWNLSQEILSPQEIELTRDQIELNIDKLRKLGKPQNSSLGVGG